MARIDVDTRGLQRLQKQFAEYGAQLKNRTKPNREVSVELYQFVVRNFDQSGKLVGVWAPLAESTIRQKRKIGKELPLIRTGQLRNSFAPFSNRQEAGVRSELFYAPFHNEGTRTIPQRRLVPNQQETLKIAVPIYKRYVTTQAKKVFR